MIRKVTEVYGPFFGQFGHRAWAYLWEGEDVVVVFDKSYTAVEANDLFDLVRLRFNGRKRQPKM